MDRTTTGRPLGSTFRALLGATAVSNLGDGIRLAALPMLAVTLTDSPRLVAGVTAAQFLPWLVFGPIGGVIVDRADRRRLILVTQTGRAAVMVGLGIAVLTDMVSIWIVFAVAFVITAGEILVDPSVVATVPTIVDRRDLDRANGKISSVDLVTNDLVGAPVGTGLFVVFPWLPFVADGLSYVGSTALFRHLPSRPRPETPHDPGSGPALGAAMAELPVGLRWLWGHPMLRRWTAAVAAFNVGAAAAFSLLVKLVLDDHGGSSISYGVTLTAAAMAGALGAALAPGLIDRFGRPPVMLISAGLGAASLLILARAPSLTVVVAVWSVVGGSGGVMMAIGRGFVQRYCPNEILGRAAIASRTITRTAFVVGAGIGGEVASRSSIPAAIAVGGAVQFVSLIPMGLALRHDHD